MKARRVKKNDSGNRFLGAWCAVGYQTLCVGSTSTKGLQSKTLSCRLDQLLVTGLKPSFSVDFVVNEGCFVSNMVVVKSNICYLKNHYR